jgi:sugar O-acyltransferase (sialic acid O-acetyltransferase NeuD family)
MLIVGAKGFAKEVLEIVHKNDSVSTVAFYDDVNEDIGDYLYNQYPILKSEAEVKEFFGKFGNEFTIGIGGPNLRRMLYDKFTEIGGDFISTISENAVIGSFGNEIGKGSNLMQNIVLTNDIYIGSGVIINQLASIGHDVIINDFCEICPNVSISGNCEIGEYSFIGTGAIILPKVKIGKNVIIGAGAVVSKDLPDNCVAVGVPAKIIKQN